MIILFAMAVLCGTMIAQTEQSVNPRRGYIGLAMGPAFSMGDIESDNVGVSVSIANFVGGVGKLDMSASALTFGVAYRIK